VDAIRASNPPANPALLDALEKDFVAHAFDLRHLMRTIVNSRTYQASFATNEWNASDRDNFSHALPRRLSAEELMDAVSSAAGARPHFPDVPEDMTASELVDPHVAREGFLDVFGRPARAVAHRLHWPDGPQPSSLLLLACAGGGRGQQVRRRARLGVGEERRHDLPPGWAVAHRYLGSKARCAGEHPRRIQTDQDQDSRHLDRRAHADDGGASGQGDVDPVDELHTERPV